MLQRWKHDSNGQMVTEPDGEYVLYEETKRLQTEVNELNRLLWQRTKELTVTRMQRNALGEVLQRVAPEFCKNATLTIPDELWNSHPPKEKKDEGSN